MGSGGELLMITESAYSLEVCCVKNSSKIYYLGIVTPAFSHAWINAEPAIAQSVLSQLAKEL